jgi:hypothetical protein
MAGRWARVPLGLSLSFCAVRIPGHTSAHMLRLGQQCNKQLPQHEIANNAL